MLLVIFGLSGAAALTYEVLWVRQFTLVLGASSYAVTTILATFMTGLALGAFGIGRLVDRASEPSLARWYTGLEIGIGLYALLIPQLLRLALELFVPFCIRFQPGMAFFNTLRVGFSFGLLLLPTMLMGGTLPVLARYSDPEPRVDGPDALKAVWDQHAGGAAGRDRHRVLPLAPWLGTHLTNALGAGTNFLAASPSFGTGTGTPGPRKPGPARPTRKRPNPVRCTAAPLAAVGAMGRPVVFGLFGAAAMILQVAWTRGRCR